MKTLRFLPSTLCVLATLGWAAALGCGDSDDDSLFGGNGQGGAGSQTTAAGPGVTSATTATTATTGTTGTSSVTNGSGTTTGMPMCGDFICEPSECGVCSPDCGAVCNAACGDGTCDANEDCMSCPADCQTGCGDGCCLLGENCQNCAADCITVEGCDPSACGNGQCNYYLSETCLNCADCFGLCDCGDGACAGPETSQNCPADCNNG